MKMETVFVRKERKYLIDEFACEQLKMRVSEFLIKKRFKKTNDISFVKSVYLDSDCWRAYYDHKNRKKKRFKVRIRKYGINGKKYFVELKEKVNGITHKRRFKIKKKWIEEFLNGEDIFPKLQKYNNKIACCQLLDIYDAIKGKIESCRLKPVIQIEYQRESFEDVNKIVRITFDRNLRFEAFENSFMKPVREFHIYPLNGIIMETKTIRKRPDWLKVLISEYGLKKQSFSKYCTSVESIYGLWSDQYVTVPSLFSKEEKHARIS
jgi:hypothetical protein